MQADRSNDFATPSLSGQRRVDQVCDRFEAAWKAGERPSIEEYLNQAQSADHPALLRELLELELDFRRGAGESPRPADYLARFPNHDEMVKQLMQSGGTRDFLLDTGDAPFQVPSTRQAAEEPAPPDLAALAPRYRIEGLVGRGAMGWVYRATRQHVDMEVAVKVVSSRYSTKRFRREAECLVKIRSPHVVTVHDFELLHDGTPILVMEWMGGGNLLEAMRAGGGRLEEHVALAWMRQTCEGMLAVAEQGVIHRDLKPTNIMIDGQGRIKVADFGLARDLRESALSATGQMMGTPYYMSPEQAATPASVDSRSDVYSFGACFYHALTGTPPFDGDSAFSVLLAHKLEPPIPPMTRNPEISEATSDLLLRCLAKSPEERFQSFRELLNHFESTPWDELEDKSLAEYVSKYQLRRADYLARRFPFDGRDDYSFPNERSLSIVVGNIEDQDADAVVNPVDWLLTMSGDVSKSILDSAGSGIRDELRCMPIRPGRVVVTSGGNMKAKRIFHAIITGGTRAEHYIPSRDVISEAMKSCFYHADSFYVRSIAFPLLASGSERFSEEFCLDAMFRFLARNLLRGVTAVREARIVLCPGGNAALAPMPAIVRPTAPGYEFFEHYQPAVDAVGDFIDYLHLPDGRIAVLVADVAGRGIPAAVTVRELAGVAKSYLTQHARPDEAVAHFNQHLCQLGTDRFATLVLIVLDPKHHLLTIVNAGHLRPLWRRANGRVDLLGESQVGIPLGIETGERYDLFVMTISPGESITIVTDGVTQALGEDGSMYGNERLRKCVSASAVPEAIVGSIVNDVRNFVSAPLIDAVCVLSFGRK